MQQLERTADHQEALIAAMEGWQRKLWTATPGIIQTPVGADGTVSIQPAIKAKVRSSDGKVSEQALPLLIHCPVHCFGGGGFSLTAPLAQGDECLVVFGSRCIDGWWQSGGVQSQIEMRMHDLSDGFCIPGFRSMGRALGSYSQESFQLRTDNGQAYYELTPTRANIKAMAGVAMDTPDVATLGNLRAGTGATGTFTAASGQIVTVADGIIINIF